MPPGTCLTSMVESTPFNPPSNSAYFSLISLKKLDTSSSASRSRLISLSCPSKIASIVSVAVCPYVILRDEMEVSILSIPASIAFIFVAVDMPVVACVCIWTGIEIVSFRLFTRLNASKGLSKPAISLMARESAPASSIFLARSNHVSKL